MSVKPINANLRPDKVLTTGQTRLQPSDKQAELPLGDVPAARAKLREAVAERDNAIAAKWFSEAIDHYPKAGSLAAELGITDAYLSQMRAGERTIPLRAVLPLLKHRQAAKALLAPMSEPGGLAPPTEKRRIKKRAANAAVARTVRKLVDIWGLIRERCAEEARTSVDDLEAALSSPGSDEEAEDVAEAK